MSGVVQAKVLIFKTNLLFPSFKYFSEPVRNLCLLIAGGDFKEGWGWGGTEKAA